MDLITLDENRQPKKLIEGYDSLIWTERFNDIGDFELKTGDVLKFLDLLPEGTLLSLRESNVVMIVETHYIQRKKNQPVVLTIKGRAFESVLDRRVAIKELTGDVGEWSVTAKTPSDVAHYIAYKICVDGILSSDDILDSNLVQFVTPTDYLTTSGPTKQFSVQKGSLLTAVLELLKTEAKVDNTTTPATPAVKQHGLKSVRPNSDGTAISLVIYQGVDKSADVYFDGSRNLLDDGSYLFSKVGSASTAYILSEADGFIMNKQSGVTGLDRRVILLDATTSGISDESAIRAQAETALAEAKEIAMFDGSINQDIVPYVYGVDYNLGDIVMLAGDYDLNSPARVTEYIRAEDGTGFKSYPTLISLT